MKAHRLYGGHYRFVPPTSRIVTASDLTQGVNNSTSEMTKKRKEQGEQSHGRRLTSKLDNRLRCSEIEYKIDEIRF